MADKVHLPTASGGNLDLKGIISIFQILSNTNRSKATDIHLAVKTTTNFDDLLALNLCLLWRALETEEHLRSCQELKLSFCGIFEQEPSLKRMETGSTVNIDSTSVRLIFYRLCLHSLYLLKLSLMSLKRSENSTRVPVMDLSVKDQQIIKTVIQFIVALGICPNLFEGVGASFKQRTGFGDALCAEQKIKCPQCLYKCVMVLVNCLDEPSLSLLILSKHLADVLASLIQLGYCGDVCQEELVGSEQLISSHEENDDFELGCKSGSVENELADQNNDIANKQDLTGTTLTSNNICEGGVLISKAEQEKCRKALNDIINKMYQPLIIRELMFLQGNMSGQKIPTPRGKSSDTDAHKESRPGIPPSERSDMKGKTVSRTPKWMSDVCGHLLSKCLTKSNGVENILRAILEGSSGTTNEWKICEAIAQVIANCPIQIQSPEEYYKSISPQVLKLLQLPSSKLQQQYSRASVQIIHAMLRKYPEIASKYIADSLMRPFLIMTLEPEERKQTVIVDEREMTCCIEGLHKVFVASPNSSPVMMKNMARIIVPVFELFCFVRHSASHVKTALLELLSTYFKRTNNLTALTILYVFICKELPNSESKNAFLVSENTTKPSGNSGDAGDPSNVRVPSEDVGKHSDVRISELNLISNRCSFEFGENGGIILKKTASSKDKVDENVFGRIFGKETAIYETRALCFVEILRNLRKNEIPGNFFLYLLQEVQKIILKPNFQERMKALVIFNVLALMCEKLGPAVLKNTGHIIQFIDTTLTRAHHVYVESEGAAGVFELETLTMALGMLSALLGGAVKVESSDFVKLQTLTPILLEIAESHVEEEIKEQANDLMVVILTKTNVLREKGNVSHEKTNRLSDGTKIKGNNAVDKAKEFNLEAEDFEGDSDLDFDTAFEQLCDPLLPVRGHALIRLGNLLKARDTKAVAKVDILVKTFRDSLMHEDSYIYLAAVEGLVAAADIRSDDVIPYLAREFMACCREGTEASGEIDKEEYKCFLKEKDKKATVKRSSNTRLKVGEALVRAVKRCGELVPKYFQILTHSFLVGVRDVDSFVRASSLSNLGEMFGLSPHMLPTIVHEAFHCVSTVLRSDKASEVRRAAVLVLTLVLKGLDQKTIQVLSDKLKDIYQLLKQVESSDQDETTRIHAQVTLGELNRIMRKQLFPEQRLVKHIKVLP
ncbi:transport and Golgi organization protein 6 homolog [Dendronephthya gigantea]|uniref:transport and Golgi organization protein 6 homolog n=1 Tax=Dendronephthya gigantea TaxID=151771 RepID=UPI00106CD26A|nr:transport and Golgi organization protein 6 homolog [Dendronephthya gigantea]